MQRKLHLYKCSKTIDNAITTYNIPNISNILDIIYDQLLKQETAVKLKSMVIIKFREI